MKGKKEEMEGKGVVLALYAYVCARDRRQHGIWGIAVRGPRGGISPNSCSPYFCPKANFFFQEWF